MPLSPRRAALLLALMLALLAVPGARANNAKVAQTRRPDATATPIHHLVVIFQENVSFDHYFGTYPVAANPPGEPAFIAAPNTPAVNGLSSDLLNNNPNMDAPFRLDRTQALTCDQDHNYTDEQKSFDNGGMDQFVQFVEGKASSPAQYCPADAAGNLEAVMGYFDGNTVTALWNYAQHFAMSDNSFGTTFGPSTPGALNLVAGDTSGVVCGPTSADFGDIPACGDKDGQPASTTATAAPTNGNLGTNYGDKDPFWDICSKQDASDLLAMQGPNIGDLLNRAGLSWGWFEGGFALNPDGTCNTSKQPDVAYDAATGVDPASDPNGTANSAGYIPHHQPFQYYASTANPQHLPPSSAAMIGQTDQANHQYDLASFWQAAGAGNLPAVSFLKAPAYQDGHAGYSNPLDEQQFLVETMNHLQKLPAWRSTAVAILYDDSDGWYDHVPGPIVSQSATPLDTGCGTTNSMDIPARCGYGPRLPLLVISPFAKQNYVSYQVSDQSSVIRFIEDNWLGGQRVSATSFDTMAGSLLDMFDFSRGAAAPLFLDPGNGEPQLGQP